MKRVWLVLNLGVLVLGIIVMDFIKISYVMMIDIEVVVCYRGLEGVIECLFRFEFNRNDVLFFRYCCSMLNIVICWVMFDFIVNWLGKLFSLK